MHYKLEIFKIIVHSIYEKNCDCWLLNPAGLVVIFHALTTQEITSNRMKRKYHYLCCTDASVISNRAFTSCRSCRKCKLKNNNWSSNIFSCWRLACSLEDIYALWLDVEQWAQESKDALSKNGFFVNSTMRLLKT